MNNVDKLKTYKRILCIVESPAKVKTVSKIFKDLGLSNIIVKASVGHISNIKDSGIYNMGIDPSNFDMDLIISDDKKDVVKGLKEQVSLADFIILASDGDREGEAIAWSLKKFLKIPDKKYERIVYHEITKSAIQEALNNPLKINDDLVDAAHARAKLDKIVGYRLSPVARNNIKARSVGRCQSAGLKLVVDREKEITNFKPETHYEMYLHFKKNKVDFTAKYQGNGDKLESKLKSIKDCDCIAKECKGKDYYIDNIEQKLTKQNSPQPFVTSTFQQEAASKLGLSVKTAMSAAQRLFEGIDINGEHIALTTYLRTDSPIISEEFVPKIKDYIINNFGKEYYQGVKTAKKKENAQEGHECLRCIDLTMTPDRLKEYITDEILIKVYSLIYKRTIASLMSARTIFETSYTIKNDHKKNSNNHIFLLTSKEEKFDGWRRIYNVDNDKDETIKETFKKDEILKDTGLERVEKETQPPARYTEASLIKKLDALGIGRPSTYATIISTLLDTKRNYCKIIDKKMYATDLAISLIDFLDKYFVEIVNPSYTSNLEKSLDKIAEGELKEVDFLRKFYDKLDEDINKEEEASGVKIKEERKCPNCGATLVYKRGKFGAFLACPNYPTCKYTEKI